MLRYLAFITIGCATLVAQNPYGRITGRVTDSAGALVPGVTVRVIHESTNVATATASNAEGNYEALNLNPGRYRLVAELSGFKRYERGPIEVRVGDVLNVLVEMEIGTLTESVSGSCVQRRRVWSGGRGRPYLVYASDTRNRRKCKPKVQCESARPVQESRNMSGIKCFDVQSGGGCGIADYSGPSWPGLTETLPRSITKGWLCAPSSKGVAKIR